MHCKDASLERLSKTFTILPESVCHPAASLYDLAVLQMHGRMMTLATVAAL